MGEHRRKNRITHKAFLGRLDQLAERLTTEVPGVVSVTYNTTKKPPSTIEAI